MKRDIGGIESVIKDGYYWAKKIADKSQGWCMCMKIPADNEKCVELLE